MVRWRLADCYGSGCANQAIVAEAAGIDWQARHCREAHRTFDPQ